MDEEYRHTQIGTATIVLILLVAVFTTLLVISALDSIARPVVIGVALLVGGLFGFTLAAFSSFTIQVIGGELAFWFGIGVGRKSIAISDIQLIGIVDTPWYYFWGIKSIPGGWLYSIAPGGKAIELVLRDKKKIRLGTDRPDEIIERVNRELKISQ